MYKKILATGIVVIFFVGISVDLFLSSDNPEDIILENSQVQSPEIVDDEVQNYTLRHDNTAAPFSEVQQWVSLNFESPDYSFCIAREAIRAYLADWNPAEHSAIAIGFYDLNHDGIDEIIAVISGDGWGGSRNTGCLLVFRYDGESIMGSRHLGSTMLHLQYLDDPASQQIGIIRSETGWDYIYQNGWLRETTPYVPHSER